MLAMLEAGAIARRGGERGSVSWVGPDGLGTSNTGDEGAQAGGSAAAGADDLIAESSSDTPVSWVGPEGLGTGSTDGEGAQAWGFRSCESG